MALVAVAIDDHCKAEEEVAGEDNDEERLQKCMLTISKDIENLIKTFWGTRFWLHRFRLLWRLRWRR